MLMVMPHEGKLWALDNLFRVAGAGEAFTLDLFQNNETVDDLSTAADFTISTFPGYAQVAIARADFNVAVIVAAVGEIVKNTAPTFTCTGGGGQLAYGWIFRGAASGIVVFGQNFNSPRNMVAGAVEAIDPFKIKDKTFA